MYLGDGVFVAAIPVFLKPGFYALLCYKLSCSTVSASTATQGNGMNGAWSLVTDRGESEKNAPGEAREKAAFFDVKNSIFDVKKGISCSKSGQNRGFAVTDQ